MFPAQLCQQLLLGREHFTLLEDMIHRLFEIRCGRALKKAEWEWDCKPIIECIPVTNDWSQNVLKHVSGVHSEVQTPHKPISFKVGH